MPPASNRPLDEPSANYAKAADNEDIGKLTRTFGSVVYFVEKIIDEAAPALELEQLAQTKDLPGLLAQRILELQQCGAESDRLVAEARGALDEARPLCRRCGG